jgi:hypothetical protein
VASELWGLCPPGRRLVGDSAQPPADGKLFTTTILWKRCPQEAERPALPGSVPDHSPLSRWRAQQFRFSAKTARAPPSSCVAPVGWARLSGAAPVPSSGAGHGGRPSLGRRPAGKLSPAGRLSCRTRLRLIRRRLLVGHDWLIVRVTRRPAVPTGQRGWRGVSGQPGLPAATRTRTTTMTRPHRVNMGRAPA